jgi:hypothetical protein
MAVETAEQAMTREKLRVFRECRINTYRNGIVASVASASGAFLFVSLVTARYPIFRAKYKTAFVLGRPRSHLPPSALSHLLCLLMRACACSV